jgi:hypothetical protein
VSRQYFADTLSEPVGSAYTTITATTETVLIPTALTTIPANEPRPGKVYQLIVGGTCTTGTAGTLIITPRYGLVIGGTTLTASPTQNYVPSITTAPRYSHTMRSGGTVTSWPRAARSIITSATSADAKWNKILAFYGKAAGEKLTILNDVYKSEAATNTGNKALAALLLKYERIYADTLESVDVYTKQCSVGVTAKQLATMGATLANFGANPVTGEQVIKRENVPEILSAMTMAGLYDGSGGWAWHVGLPAKSGVGGGIIAVVPGKGAIAVFAPPLDKAGNSVKAQLAIAYVAEKLGINLYSPRSVGLK